ncbi:nitroreductase [Spongiibacter sp. KMU-158]|uniref:Putative NAD(P)H nitroreductase n=1 Tax=Spongiibacter pelagi TaxID=2760804 RepID=A0A927C0F9_9GAMM|nr:nitroreductase [Spongiibacter pelagi]MBD2858973.1 nitroreductase [Spongiibacter pelagi]
MDALSLLQRRNSAPKLCEPAPTEAEYAEIFEAAARVPDHARLRPWRLRVIEGAARKQLGQLFVDAAQKRNPDFTEAELQRFRDQPLRAPSIIVVSARIQAHPKVPDIEQRLSAGCAAYAVLLAAEALGYAGIWRTGDHAFDPVVHAGLGMEKGEEIIGFLYLGSRDGAAKPLPDVALSEFVQYWNHP